MYYCAAAGDVPPSLPLVPCNLGNFLSDSCYYSIMCGWWPLLISLSLKILEAEDEATNRLSVIAVVVILL